MKLMRVLLWGLLAVGGAASGQLLPSGAYVFAPSWCPRPDELSKLSEHLDLKMNGCCIAYGVPRTPGAALNEVLAPWRSRMMTNYYPGAKCDAEVLTVEQERNPEAYAAELEARAKKELMAKKDAQVRAAPVVLRAMDLYEFCRAYGAALRGTLPESLELLEDGKSLFKAEARRRKISFNDALIERELIRVGISQCQMYAAWGFPEKANRSVGSWGVHTQHVYGDGQYVYTENGVVRSFQD